MSRQSKSEQLRRRKEAETGPEYGERATPPTHSALAESHRDQSLISLVQMEQQQKHDVVTLQERLVKANTGPDRVRPQRFQLFLEGVFGWFPDEHSGWSVAERRIRRPFSTCWPC